MFGRKHKTMPDADETPATDEVTPQADTPADDEDAAALDETVTPTGDDATPDSAEEADDDGQETTEADDDADGDSPDDDESDDADDEDDADEDEEADDDFDGAEAEPAEQVDWRADGPFDYDEVDLDGDGVHRVDLGALIVTPFQDLNLRLSVREETKQADSFVALWQKSGLEVALFAASAGGDLAGEFRDDVLDETQQAGGTAVVEDGPFGPQVHKVVPGSGGNGEDKFHVSRVWLVEGPRWLLRGTLLGPAATGEVDNPDAAPFVEFFRNLVVRRGGKPMVPGDAIPLDVPVAGVEG